MIAHHQVSTVNLIHSPSAPYKRRRKNNIPRRPIFTIEFGRGAIGTSLFQRKRNVQSSICINNVHPIALRGNDVEESREHNHVRGIHYSPLPPICIHESIQVGIVETGVIPLVLPPRIVEIGRFLFA